MRNLIKFISLLICALFVMTPFAMAEGEAQPDVKTVESALNVSQISEEQAELCTAVMIDGFEADETERSVSGGTVCSVSSLALEGEKCVSLEGSGTAELTLQLTKRRNTANTRSLCVCAYVEPAEGASFDITVTLRGEEDVITASSDLPAGRWYAAYMPIDTGKTVEIKSVTVSVKERSSANAKVSCFIDRVHTATVDGLPDKLPYFASGFTANRGELEYTEDSLVFRPSGANSSMESLPCGYMTGGTYNALAVKINNESDAAVATLRLRLDRQYSYTEENSHSLKLQAGEQICYFPIGGFRSGATVEAFRLEFPGDVSGEIVIKSIEFSSYRFPAEYAGTVNTEITDGRIRIYGTMPDYPASTKRVLLYRLAPGFDEEEPGAIDEPPYAETPASSSFEFELPATENGYNNAYFKYLVRYETKTGYEDAGVAYVNVADPVKTSVSYKGTEVPEDVTLLSYLMPGTVYIDLDLGKLFAQNGETEFRFAGQTGHISEAALEKCDNIIDRCSSEKIKTVIRLVYSPFSDADKYYFIGETGVLPDITTFEGVSHYSALLSFLAERYEGKLSAVIPCGVFNSKESAEMRNLTPDKAEKYDADLIFAAQAVLSKHKISVIAPVEAEGADVFLSMLRQEMKYENLTVYIKINSAAEAEDVTKTAAAYAFDAILSCRVENADELVRLYCFAKDASGICVRGLYTTDVCSELFSVIDTTYGVSAAETLVTDGFPGGIKDIWPGDEKTVKMYVDQGVVASAEMMQTVTAIYDGSSADGWSGFDCCKSVYPDQVNGEAAAALSFDYSSGCFGYAAFYPQKSKTYGVVCFKLYADHLPEDVPQITLRIFAESEKGVTVCYCTLEAGTASVIPMQLSSAGRINRFTFAPADAGEGSTPRICVAGIYVPGGDPSDTVTEAQPETMPEPETQVFETAGTTSAEQNGGGDGARLYITAILVIIGMFALCGIIMLILKKHDKNKQNTL